METSGRMVLAEGGFPCHECDEWIPEGVPYIEPPHEEGYEGWAGVCLSCYDALSRGVGPSQTFEARLTPQGNSLGVRVPSEALDAIGADRGDHLHVTIRRVE